MENDNQNPPRSNEEDTNLGPSGDNEQTVDNNYEKQVNETPKVYPELMKQKKLKQWTLTIRIHPEPLRKMQNFVPVGT